jgi:hypothetical protein
VCDFDSTYTHTNGIHGLCPPISQPLAEKVKVAVVHKINDKLKACRVSMEYLHMRDVVSTV